MMGAALSTGRRVAYALGATGFQITDRIVVAVAMYFYLPPGGRGLEAQVPTELLGAGLTAFGVAMLIGRLFDMWADPIVGHASDRSRSSLGRRRAYMLAGVLPMVGLPLLLFWPPGEPGSWTNFYWLACVLGAYFIFFTVYVSPYLALIPEIATTEPERVKLAAIMAAVSFPIVGVFGAAWGVGIDIGHAGGLDTATSVRAVVVIGSVAALLLCLSPILAIDERRLPAAAPPEGSIWQAVKDTVRNRAFCQYLLAQLPFIIGVNLIQPALVYYATVVLGRTEGFALALGMAIFVPTLLGFLLVNWLTRRFGAKRAMMFCVGTFALSLGALGLLRPDGPGGPNDSWNLGLVFGVMVWNGLPLAGFLVLPPVLIGQCIDWDEVHTGAGRAAMYFGMQGFITKLPYGISAAILAYLFQQYGASAEAPLGVLLVGPAAGAFCLLSFVLFALYPERQLLQETRRARSK